MDLPRRGGPGPRRPRGHLMDQPTWERHSPLLLGSGVPGLVLLVWGLVALRLLPTVIGGIWVLAAKTWFNHRMVRLVEAMARVHPPYRAWLY